MQPGKNPIYTLAGAADDSCPQGHTLALNDVSKPLDIVVIFSILWAQLKNRMVQFLRGSSSNSFV